MEEFKKATEKDFRDIPNIRSTGFYKFAKKAVMKIEALKGNR